MEEEMIRETDGFSPEMKDYEKWRMVTSTKQKYKLYHY